MTDSCVVEYAALAMRGLYAILDVSSLRARQVDPVAFADAVLKAAPAALQLRAKDGAPHVALALLRELVPMCHRAGVALVANDRPDWAMAAGCDGVHVGQTDMPIEQVRRLAPELAVGVSTHSMEQLEAALAARPAYVAFGPVFETSTKWQADPVVGVDSLFAAYARARAARVPLVAIGGITRDRVRDVVGLADAVAVVSGLLPPIPASGPLLPTGNVLRQVTLRALAFQQAFAAEAPMRLASSRAWPRP